MVSVLTPDFNYRPKSERRFMMYVAQGGECWYCGNQMVLYLQAARYGCVPDNYATIEHLLPLHRNTRSRQDKKELGRSCNKVLACYRCNHLRGDRPLPEFIDELRTLGLTRGIVSRIQRLVNDHMPEPAQADAFDRWMIDALAHPSKPAGILNRLPEELVVVM